MIIHGPSGSAKTTSGRLRRGVTDPSSLETIILRAEQADWVQALAHNYSPVLDNLGTLTTWQSDLLCQASTGGGFTKRAHYTDDDDIIYSFRRPVIMTGINIPARAPDLLNRSLLIECAPIPPEERKEEVEVWEAFERDRPAILGGLLNALSSAMRLRDEIKLGRLPRMADATRWGAAASEALGYGASAFVDAVNRNAARQVQQVVEDDPIASALRDFASAHRTWTGSASELWKQLSEEHEEKAAERRWPKAPSTLGKRLVVLTPTLAALGVELTFERGDDRVWSIRWTR
jgi:hypothetical protein